MLLGILLGLPVLAQSDLLDDLKNAQGLPGYAAVEALTPPPTADVAMGKQLAEVYCINCHGMNLDGEGYLEGASMDPPPSLRYSKNYRFGYKDLSVFRTIKYGVPLVMEPSEEPLTDSQIWALTAYVRSQQKE
jgi:mono/diheme cytochrome c family protein